MTPPSDQSYRLIPLTQGKFAKVDISDYECLNGWKWRAAYSPHTGTFYAVRHSHIKEGETGPRHPVQMARTILGLEYGERYRLADHINMDTLDNRRANLRIATISQNICNRGLQSNNKSGFKGVFKRNDNGRWRAKIGHLGKHISLGCFATRREAVEAYARAAQRLHGEFFRPS